MENRRILLNAIRTPDGTLLHSKHRHDCVIYKDKNGKEYGVDGGSEYLRRIGDTNDCQDCSIMDDGTHETRRSNLRWGVNYDKDMNRLPETEWRLIKDLNTDHIKAILDGGYSKNNSFYEELFKEELEYRLAEK